MKYIKFNYKLNNFVILIISILFTTIWNITPAHSQSAKTAENGGDNEGDVSTVLTPHNTDAIFKENASYTFSVKNGLNTTQTGKISYVVVDQFNKQYLADSVAVSINKNSTQNYNLNIPPLKTGFYKINIMINVSDYDDTTRRAFGIRANEIRSAHPKPADFDTFWQSTKQELANIKPDFKMTEQPDKENYGEKVYMIQMQSLGNMTIYGWMTVPHQRSKHQKFPVLVMLPGYQATTQPLIGPDADVAFISVDVRGQGLNRTAMALKRDDYIIDHLDDKSKYWLRGVIMDCIRYIDFVCSRPELDQSRICVTGGSMGGYTAIATAALDKRVALCAPQNPFMSDVYNMDNGAVKWPINFFKDYVKSHPSITYNQVLDNLQYFDTKNFATLISCPVFMGIGLLDPYVPPNNSYAVFNNINAKKKIMVFKDLGHEVGAKYSNYEILWMRDAFGLF